LTTATSRHGLFSLNFADGGAVNAQRSKATLDRLSRGEANERRVFAGG
jgi:hypothetical protein